VEVAANRSGLKGSHEAGTENQRAHVLGMQWHWLSSDKATGAAQSENLSGSVQGVRWQGKNYRRRQLRCLEQRLDLKNENDL